MTTNTTNSQTPEILAKQVVEWRKEVARLNDLIAHAEGRDSQAASIDTPAFRSVLMDLNLASGQALIAKYQAQVITYIDAKLAQAREEATGRLAIAFEKMLCAAIGRDWSASGISVSSLVEDLRNRAIAAESRLAEIQRGVEGLTRWDYRWDSDVCASEFGCYKDGNLIERKDVLALLAPHGQASTCEHNIVSAVNQIVKSGMFCTKCGKLFKDDGTPIVSDTSGLPG